MLEKPVVCVIDDDLSVRRALSRLLKDAGYVVEAFESAGAYCERYTASPPGCLVLDMRMAAMSGLELQRRLNSMGCAPPILFVTANSEENKRQEALAAGAVDVLYKPLRRALFLDAVDRALRTRSILRPVN